MKFKRAVSCCLAVIMIFAALSLSGCSQSSNTLVVVTWGGASTDAQREAIFKPFEKEYNCKIVEVTPVDYGKFQAMVESGKIEWDVVDCDTDFAIRAEKNGWLEKLDYSKINSNCVSKEMVRDCSIASYTYGYSLGYNNQKFSDGKQPKTWADFWDVDKFPGERTMWKYPVGTLEIALLADGVEMQDLYPLDIDRAFNSLDKIKADITLWWSSASQTTQGLCDGSIEIGAMMAGRILEASDNNAPINLEFNQTAIYQDSWIVPKGCQNKDLAMEFISFAMDAERQANLAKLYPYAPSMEEGYSFLTDAEKSRQPGNPDVVDTQFYINYEYWAENYDEINERFQEWLIK